MESSRCSSKTLQKGSCPYAASGRGFTVQLINILCLKDHRKLLNNDSMLFNRLTNVYDLQLQPTKLAKLEKKIKQEHCLTSGTPDRVSIWMMRSSAMATTVFMMVRASSRNLCCSSLSWLSQANNLATKGQQHQQI